MITKNIYPGTDRSAKKDLYTVSVSTAPMWSRVAYLKFSHSFRLICASRSWYQLHFKEIDSKHKSAFAVLGAFRTLDFLFWYHFIGRIWPCICKSLNSQEIQNLPTTALCSLFLQPSKFSEERVAALCTDPLHAGEKEKTRRIAPWVKLFPPPRAFPSPLLRRDLSTSPALATVIVKRVYKPPLVKVAGV